MRKDLLIAAGGRCATCGYAKCETGLQFHHVDPQAKLFDLGIAARKSRAAYLAEAAKCVVVCANCHGEIETGLVPCPPAGAKFGELERRAVQLSLA